MGKLRAAAVVLALGLSGCEPAYDPPPDRDVLALFAGHRSDFNKIRDMLLSDSISAIQLSPDGPKLHLDGGTWKDLRYETTARQREYLRILDGMGISRVDRGWGGTPKDFVRFTVYSFGNVADSYTKSIVYSRKPLNPLSLDTDTPEFRRDNSVVYAEIGDGWYIEKERD